MNFYSFHIGDFRSGSANLSRLERWIYRDMLDFYYDKEKPLPLDFDLLCDEIGVSDEQEKKAVAKILRVKFTKDEEGYLNARCEKEIAKYHEKALVSIKNGRLGGRRRADAKPNTNPAGTQQVILGTLEPSESQANQEPRTKNHEKDLKTLTNPDGLVVPGVAEDVKNSADSAKQCPHQAIIDIYHEALPMCPRIRDWTPARQAHLRARWNEDARRQSLSYWAEFFTYVGQCDFLVGRVPGKGGAPPFVCSLSWIVKHENFTKIRERNYENRGAA